MGKDVRINAAKEFDPAAAAILVIGVPDSKTLGDHALQVDQLTGGTVKRLVAQGDVTGKEAEITLVPAPHGIGATHLMVVGLGDSSNNDPGGAAYRIAASCVRRVNRKPRERIVFALDTTWDEQIQEAAVAGSISGSVGQDLYRAEPDRSVPQEIVFVGFSENACRCGRVIGESINLTRNLINLPAQDLYPGSFAEQAADVGQRSEFSVEVWDEQRLHEEKCGALLAVARGSAKPPRLVVARYEGAGEGQPRLGLVGKGVTFDSGGLSLKPTDGMLAMKCDMGGAATVLGAMQAIAQLKLPINVVAVMGLVENMISGDSYKLGDVLTSRSGKTIEVHNTDAEGRLVLADALHVALENGADHLVDLATLTGACLVALGMDVAGVMTNDANWCEQIKSSAARAGERVWELPMFDFYGEQIRGKVADIKNVGDGRWGGAITAAKFLEEFVNDKPWVHIDIAGPSFLDKPKDWCDAGATGLYVRTLVELARVYRASA